MERNLNTNRIENLYTRNFYMSMLVFIYQFSFIKQFGKMKNYIFFFINYLLIICSCFGNHTQIGMSKYLVSKESSTELISKVCNNQAVTTLSMANIKDAQNEEPPTFRYYRDFDWFKIQGIQSLDSSSLTYPYIKAYECDGKIHKIWAHYAKDTTVAICFNHEGSVPYHVSEWKRGSKAAYREIFYFYGDSIVMISISNHDDNRVNVYEAYSITIYVRDSINHMMSTKRSLIDARGDIHDYSKIEIDYSKSNETEYTDARIGVDEYCYWLKNFIEGVLAYEYDHCQKIKKTFTFFWDYEVSIRFRNYKDTTFSPMFFPD